MFALSVLALGGAARAADGRLVVVEFQPVTDDEAGLAYLVYSTVAEGVSGEGHPDVIAGEDVEMYLGGAASDCDRKPSCLTKLAERFDATVAVFTSISRKGTQLAVEMRFISLRSGAVLESARRRYEAGEEGQITDLILDRVEGVIEAASWEEDDLADSVADDGEEEDTGDGDDIDWDEDEDEDDGGGTAVAVAGPAGRDDGDTGADGDDGVGRSSDDGEDDHYRRSGRDDEEDDRYRRSGRDDGEDDRYRRSGRDDEEDGADAVQSDRDEDRKKSKKSKKDTKRKKKRGDGEDDGADDGDTEEETPLIDPDLLETFDDYDSSLYDETERAGSGQDMTLEEAAEQGIGKIEFRQFQWSGLSVREWKHRRFDHKGTFHIRAGGFYGLGGLDMYYSTRVVVNPTTGAPMENYYWQSLGFSAGSGGGALGAGFGVSSVVEIGLEFAVIAGEQWLLRERRTPDSVTINTFGTTSRPPPQGAAAYLGVEPKARFYVLPFKRLKPYGGLALEMLFMPGFKIPEEWAEDRPASFVLGFQPALGLQLDTPTKLGFFLEVPFTVYLATDHAVETGTEGETDYLTDSEQNEMYPPTRFMMQVKAGVQIRI